MSNRHPDRFDPQKRYFSVLAPDHDYPLSAGDINESQSIGAWRTKTVGDALLQDGNVVRGGAINVNANTGMANLEEGGVYLEGMVHQLEPASFTIPLGRVVRVGVCLTKQIVTHLQDPDLVMDIIGAEDYGEPTAHRGKVTAVWTFDEQVCEGRFVGVYEVSHGVVIDQTPPPQFDPLNAALARYDRDANGHYIVTGWQVRALGLQGGKQVFSISEGTANVWGNKISRDAALRLIVPEDPDLHEVEAEPHQVPSGSSGATSATGSVTIAANHAPVIDLKSVTVIREKTVTLTHGPYSGVSDPLPDTSVSEVVTINQGGTDYTPGSDYVLSSDQIDWSVPGDEPSPGSSYRVTYRYLDTGDPQSWDESGVTVSDVVAGTTVILNYLWALPRIDAICVNRDGNVHYVKGLPSAYQPWAPSPAPDQLRIAQIVNHWGKSPEVRNTGTRAVHNNQLELHGDLIYDLFDLVAHERLKRDMDATQPTAKRGVFTDPFLDDDMRDQGLSQTGAIVGGALQLPIEGTVSDISLGENPILLPFIEEEVIVQDLVTDCHKINPYMAFEPLPAPVVLDPAIDIWTVFATDWASDITERFVSTERRTVSRRINARGWGRRVTTNTDTSSSTVSRSELVGTDREDDAFIRVRNVSFRIEGFGVGEILDQATFDGLDVTGTIPGFPLSAGVDGHIEGQFLIPDNIPAGTKQVVFEGKGGSRGSATYVGHGIIVTKTWRNVFTTTVRNIITTNIVTWNGGDPVAQSFALREARHLTGVAVKFCRLGNRTNPVVLQTRETVNGVPGRTSFGECVLDMNSVLTGEWTKLPLSALPFLDADTRYANVLMSDDPEHSVAIARLGGFDADKQRHVGAQPYQVGVFFDGSIDEAWKPHHDKDLAFKVFAARFTATYREVDAGSLQLANCSDLIVSCGFEEPAAECSITVRITRANGEVIRSRPGQPIRFDDHLTETIGIVIEMRGTQLASPTLYPFVQVVQGNLRSEGSYISRAMPADPGGDVNVVITFDCLLPGGSDIAVSVGQPDNWQPAVLHGATPLGDGWQERSYKLENVRAADVRTRLEISGLAGARPLVRNLRANVTSDPINIISGS